MFSSSSSSGRLFPFRNTSIALFRIVEKDPPRQVHSSSKHRGRKSTTTTRISNNNQQHHQQHQHNQSRENFDDSQARFANRNWKNYGEMPSSSSSPTSQKEFLSRTEALLEQKSDQLRKAATSSSSSANFLKTRLSNLEVTPPKQFQELSQVSFDPLDRARTKSERREALKKMKKAAMEDKQREREEDMDISHVSVVDGKSTNPHLEEMNEFGRPNQTAIASESALAQSTVFRNKLSSRRNMSTWDLLDGSSAKSSSSSSSVHQYGDLYGTKTGKKNSVSSSSISDTIEESVAQKSTSRQWEKSEGHYKHTFDESTNLEHHRDALQHSRSVYTKRELPIPGLYAYHNFMTPLEEKQIAAELTKLLLKPVAAFHAAEGRYCINLLEKKLNLKAPQLERKFMGNIDDHNENDKNEKLYSSSSSYEDPDPLAFSLHEDSPILKSVLQRASRLGLIPSMPNVVQVSEMVTPYSGYPPHLKHNSIGSYCGILNLISRAQMSFVHLDQPWAPKVLMIPRSMYVMSEDLMKQFRVGYGMLDHELKYHQTSQEVARFTKDYRLEVKFATVDVEEAPRLSVPMKASEKLEEMILSNDQKKRK